MVLKPWPAGCARRRLMKAEPLGSPPRSVMPCSPIGAASPASRVPLALPPQGSATTRQYSLATSSLCVDAAIPLGPFALWPVLPASDYYGPSAPTRRHQPATRLPCDPRSGHGGGHQVGSHVHSRPFDELGAQLCPCGIATPTPQSFSAASLPATLTDAGVPRIARVRTATQPRSVRFELVGFA